MRVRERCTDPSRAPDLSADVSSGRLAWSAGTADVIFQGEKGSLMINGNGYTICDPKGKEIRKVASRGVANAVREICLTDATRLPMVERWLRGCSSRSPWR